MKAVLSICFVVLTVVIVNADELKTKNVQARTLQLRVPEQWKEVATTLETRVAQFSIPGEKQDESADLVVFYFGGATGGVKANVERWISQFEKDGLTLKMFKGKCGAGRYVLVDTTGTWNKPDGPPFARKTIVTANSRVLNVIVVEEKDDDKDYYFMKLSGPKELVSDQTKLLRQAIGYDKASEKPFELKQAEN